MDILFFKVYRNIYLRNLIFKHIPNNGKKYNEIIDINWILTHNHIGLFWEKKHLINKAIILNLNSCTNYEVMVWLHNNKYLKRILVPNQVIKISKLCYNNIMKFMTYNNRYFNHEILIYAMLYNDSFMLDFIYELSPQLIQRRHIELFRRYQHEYPSQIWTIKWIKYLNIDIFM